MFAPGATEQEIIEARKDESKPAKDNSQQTSASVADKAITKTEAEQSKKQNLQDPSREIDKLPPGSDISASDFLSKYKKNN